MYFQRSSKYPTNTVNLIHTSEHGHNRPQGVITRRAWEKLLDPGETEAGGGEGTYSRSFCESVWSPVLFTLSSPRGCQLTRFGVLQAEEAAAPTPRHTVAHQDQVTLHGHPWLPTPLGCSPECPGSPASAHPAEPGSAVPGPGAARLCTRSRLAQEVSLSHSSEWPCPLPSPGTHPGGHWEPA